MNTNVFSVRFPRTALAFALMAAFAPLHAQTTVTEGTVNIGAGLVDGYSADRALFSQYNSLRSSSNGVGMLGIDYSLREEETDTWIKFQGSNLLGDTRELNLVVRNPGAWKFTENYSETVHYDLNTIRTGLIGAGSSSPQVNVVTAGTGSELELKTKRTSIGIGLTKWITPSMQFELDLKTEKKEGSRLFGIGMNCISTAAPGCGSNPLTSTNWAVLMLPEPINANHSQIDARLSYSFEKFRFNVGYYGSFYRNNYGTLTANVPANLNNPLGVSQPLGTGLQGILGQSLALSPDNEAHQVDLSGNYDFTPTTRATFKVAYATATQNDSFAGALLGGAPAGVTNLGGQVNTTLTKIGLTSRPLPQLTLLADVRYENKEDKTPIATYNTNGSLTYTNRDLPNLKEHAKLQASWQFSKDYRGTIGTDYETIDRGVFTSTSAVSGLSALRQNTQETSFNADIRRKMAQNFSGSIGVSTSQRDGSNWLKPNSVTTGVAEISNPATGLASTAIYMPTLANRQRDKVKVFADWQPNADMTFQFSAEDGKDKFSAPTVYGLQETRMNQYSVDWNYALNYAWSLNGYVSQGVQTLNQLRPAGSLMAFENTTTSINIGIAGKASSKINVGANLTFSNDRSIYAQTLDGSTSASDAALLATTGGLPDIVYRQTVLKMFGKYELEKNSSLRLDVIYQQAAVSDWTWVSYAYSDGTTVKQNATQNVGFIGLTYTYQWQ